MFLCFEGIDGAGKSTQARMLVQRLKKEGRQAELVADPGTTQIGTAIRQILLDSDAPISPAAQMLLFSAARAELAEYIRQRMLDGITIICDRWLLSTLVYQGEINNIPDRIIVDIFNATTGISADICFLLDLSPHEALSRIGTPSDRYERRCMEDWERMCAAYHRHARPGVVAKRVQKILADKPPEETHEEIWAFLQKWSGEEKKSL